MQTNYTLQYQDAVIMVTYLGCRGQDAVIMVTYLGCRDQDAVHAIALAALLFLTFT